MSTTSPTNSAPPTTSKSLITERWESAFVYAFITRFTDIQKKIPTFNTPMDFEDAILFPGSNQIITSTLELFLKNLAPNCDVRRQHLEQTLRSVTKSYCSAKERSIWWKSAKAANLSPLSAGHQFFTASWELKLEILRQLVEWQLTHCPHIKAIIDDAWGVKHQQKGKDAAVTASSLKSKKTQTSSTKASDAAPTKDALELVPIGLDASRIRYWLIDDSSRMWSSGNPWKSKTPMTVLCSTRQEYLSIIEKLKESRPKDQAKKKAGKSEANHDALVTELEDRLPRIDDELSRVEKVYKKIRDKELALARVAELVQLRETRTRAKRRVDYAALERGNDSDDESSSGASDESSSLYGEVNEQTTARTSGRTSRASSAGLTSSSIGHKRKADRALAWRGERRSSRLSKGQFQLDEEAQTVGEPDECEDKTDSEEDNGPQSIPRAKKRRIMSPDQLSNAEQEKSSQEFLETDHRAKPAPLGRLQKKQVSTSPSLRSDDRLSPQETLPMGTDDDKDEVMRDSSSLSSVSDADSERF